jgi:hypothetical protein
LPVSVRFVRCRIFSIKRSFVRFAIRMNTSPLRFQKLNPRNFTRVARSTWYATEYDSENKLFFGYVSIFGGIEDEWGYFSLTELESYESPYGTGIERDLYWTEKKASSVIH